MEEVFPGIKSFHKQRNKGFQYCEGVELDREFISSSPVAFEGFSPREFGILKRVDRLLQITGRVVSLVRLQSSC